MDNKEKKGGFRALMEHIGTCLRYCFRDSFRWPKDVKELSMESDYPNLSKKERITCLIIESLFAILLMLSLTLLLASC